MEWGTSVSCPRIPGNLRVLLPCLGLTDLQAIMNPFENALPGRWLTFGNSSGVVCSVGSIWKCEHTAVFILTKSQWCLAVCCLLLGRGGAGPSRWVKHPAGSKGWSEWVLSMSGARRGFPGRSGRVSGKSGRSQNLPLGLCSPSVTFLDLRPVVLPPSLILCSHLSKGLVACFPVLGFTSLSLCVHTSGTLELLSPHVFQLTCLPVCQPFLPSTEFPCFFLLVLAYCPSS